MINRIKNEIGKANRTTRLVARVFTLYIVILSVGTALTIPPDDIGFGNILYALSLAIIPPFFTYSSVCLIGVYIEKKVEETRRGER